MQLLQLILWTDPTKDHTPTRGHNLLVFGPSTNESSESVQQQLETLFSKHPEYKGVAKGKMIVEVSGGHTTMVQMFLEKRHNVEMKLSTEIAVEAVLQKS